MYSGMKYQAKTTLVQHHPQGVSFAIKFVLSFYILYITALFIVSLKGSLP